MKTLFVDTAGWMACADAADPAHGRAVAARDEALEAGRVLVTTDYVADETLTLIRLRLGLPAAEKWWAQVEASPRVRWQWMDAPRSDKACACSSAIGTRTTPSPTARASSSCAS